MWISCRICKRIIEKSGNAVTCDNPECKKHWRQYQHRRYMRRIRAYKKLEEEKEFSW